MSRPSIVALGDTQDDGQTMSQAACRVWAAPELRCMIIDNLTKTDIFKSLCLDKTSFLDIVKALYREFHFQDYDSLLRPTVPYTRRKLYTESIRELDLIGATPLLRDIDGFLHLLDLFPRIKRIAAFGVELDISPSAEMDQPPTMTFHIGNYISPGRAPPFPAHMYAAEMRPGDKSQVSHDLEITGEWELDWTLSPWDHVLAPDPYVTERGWTTTSQSGSGLEVLPVARMLCRNVGRLDITLLNRHELDRLSVHLHRRRQIGFTDVSTLIFWGPNAGLPDFLRRHPYLKGVASLAIDHGSPQSLSDALLLDWDGEETASQLTLQHLTLDLDFGELDPIDAETRLEAAIQRRSSLCSFAKLKRLTLLFGPENDHEGMGIGGFVSAVSFALVAIYLLQIGGTDFDLRLEGLDAETLRERSFEMLLSQLKREVTSRQQKERRKPKYLRSESGGQV